MRRIAPSERVREEARRIFTNGVDKNANIASELMKLGPADVGPAGPGAGAGRLHRPRPLRAWVGQRVAQRLRALADQDRRRQRLDPGRAGAGIRRAVHPKLLAFLAGNSEVLERLVAEMYARGLSTRDVEDCFRDFAGELVISRTAGQRDHRPALGGLPGFLHARPVRHRGGVPVRRPPVRGAPASRRQRSGPGGVVHSPPRAARCCCTWGVGNKESDACWTEFFHSMIDRSLRAPVTVTADGAPGLRNAIDAVFANSLRIPLLVPQDGQHPRQAPRRCR